MGRYLIQTQLEKNITPKYESMRRNIPRVTHKAERITTKYLSEISPNNPQDAITIKIQFEKHGDGILCLTSVISERHTDSGEL